MLPFQRGCSRKTAAAGAPPGHVRGMLMERAHRAAMSILFFGRSHLTCVEEAFAGRAGELGTDCKFFYFQEFAAGGGPRPVRRNRGRDTVEDHDLARIRSIIDGRQPGDTICISIHGNEHFAASVIDLGLSTQAVEERVEERVTKLSLPWLKFFSSVQAPVLLIPPPPPLAEAHILAHPGKFQERLEGHAVSPAPVRIAAWKRQLELLRKHAREGGIELLELPEAVFTESGLLKSEFASDDPTHGNEKYGALLLACIAGRKANLPARASVVHATAAAKPAERKAHPYKGLEDAAFWRESVSSITPGSLDPVRVAPFRILKDDKVATAGSCFAQHISKRLRKGGFNFLVTEAPAKDEIADAELRGFYDFSARYGNIYTSRQLVQLFDRAFGFFTPLDDHWVLDNGRFCDPFRPRIEPTGYASLEELRADRQRHLLAVKKMFEELDVFVFTLGLTECWMSRLDGAAYPLAPGVAGGEYDPDRHRFANLTVDDVTRDLQAFIEKLRLVNPSARMILTVSPVPLAATYSEEHVLVATTYSKAVLRVGAEMTERSHEGVLYFPSYEIITGAYSRGKYFAEDLRTVTDEGVSHVMQVFMNRMISHDGPASGPTESALSDIESLADAVCDEALLARR